MERTLVSLKVDAVDRGLIGEIIQRFERAGFKLAGLKLVWPKKEHAEKHYTEDLAKRRGQHIRDLMVEMLTSGPIVAMAIEGVEAVELVRKMVGATEPKAAAPGTIRGDYSHVSFKHADEKKIGVNNLVHASSSLEDAKQEIAVWFTEAELHEHRPGYTKHTIAY